MAVHTAQLRVSTEGNGDVIDITQGVREVVETSDIADGVVSVFVSHSTAAITLMEYEPGGVNDFRELMNRLVPADRDYQHNQLNHDTNAHSHLQAAIIGPSETVPVRDGHLHTGTWQQFVLVDFDDSPRQRTVMVQVVG